MKNLSIHLYPQTARRWLALFVTLLLPAWGNPVLAQSADEHGHAHAEEEAHGESHEEHAEHDEHGHVHAEEEAHAETHDEHAEHDDHAHEHGAEAHDDHEDEESVVRISPEVLREFDITLGEVGPGNLREEIVLPGEIEFNREHLAYVTPRYVGTVLEIRARLADRVTKGQTLAVLESTDTLRPFEVTAPFDGTVVAYDITAGQTVEAGAALFTIANLSTVWADLRIYQRDMGKIGEGQSVLIEGGHDLPSYRGTIAYISPTVDKHTRTGLARIVVENSGGAWKPGQFIKGSVATDEHEHEVIIPRTAVLTYEGASVVFLQTEEGFEPRPVTLGHSDSESFEVTSGLSGGETIVTRNAISLKAELGKAAFGGHAGHAH